MTKPVSFETASERLRLALPLMSRYHIPIAPLNYAVWYEYVAGSSPVLRDVIDRIVKNEQTIDENLTRELYQRYVDPTDQSRVEAAQRTVRRLIEAMSVSLDAAGNEVTRYEQTLKECAAQLSTDIEADALREELAKVRVEAHSDPLTGLANRKGFEERLRALELSEDYGEHAHCLLIGDIDKFKNINDTYGHLFGDKILKIVAKAFSNLTKGKDMAARFGGEEFIILLPETPIRGALAVAESIRRSIEKGRVFNPKTGEEVQRVTISLGVTEIVHGETIEQAIARADEALYRAKEGGRNRVECLMPTPPLRATA